VSDDVAEEILRELIKATGAMRVTLRLDVPGMNFPCAAEVAGAGVATISLDNSLDQRGAATASWVADHRQVLVQPDVHQADSPPPQALIDAYGVHAQMLAPVVVNGSWETGELVGWVSVHSAVTRPWTAHDIAAITTAAVASGEQLAYIHRSPGYQRWLP
jgi:maleate isomerase